jgi:PAS domain S-box-containing protein
MDSLTQSNLTKRQNTFDTPSDVPIVLTAGFDLNHWAFLRGGGECAELISAKDWSETALGPIERWPASLRNATALLLRSKVPIVMLWGDDGIMIYNDAYSHFAGGRHPLLLGSKVREGWPEVAAFNDHVMRIGLAGETLHYKDHELTLHRDGRPERVWMDLDYSPVLDEAGEPAGVICILAETTERVAAERRAAFLLSLSDELRPLATAPEIMSVAADRIGAELDASRVFYAEITVKGWMTVERDYINGVPSIAGVHSLEDFGPDLLAAYRGGEPVVVRNVGADERLGDGARSGLQARNVGAFIDVVLFEEEQWVGLLAVQSAMPRIWTPTEEGLVQEVGERVKAAVERARAESDLRELKDTLEHQVVERTAELRRYRDIIEATAAPICAFDTDLRLIAFNRAHNEEFRRVNGFDTRIGDVLPDLFVPEQGALMRDFMARALAGESFTIVETFGRPELGTPHWEITYTPLRDADDRIVGAFHLANDISGRLAAQADLENAQEALRQSQKMEAVGQLTGGIAHDFNNMLTGVIGGLDLIQRNITAGKMDRVDKYIGAASTSAQRAAALTARLLAFGRRQSLDLKSTDINALVHGMEDLLHRTLGEQVALETALTGELWIANTDANQFENALLNLCINARDAMPDGGKLIVETANTVLDERYTREHPELEPGDYIVLSVTDTGSGMAPSTIEKVFEPFFTTKPVGQGTGLGLSMIYGFARQSGGHVRIYSELGQGTTVKLFVPRFVGEAAQENVRSVEAPRGAGETVMIVEDDPSVRLIMMEVLEELGYGAIEADDAKTAIPVLQSGRRIDLLVTDVGLPGLNGRQLAEIARDSRPDLKILFVTGYARNAAVRGGFLDPGMDMMTKPFAVDALATKVRDILES